MPTYPEATWVMLVLGLPHAWRAEASNPSACTAFASPRAVRDLCPSATAIHALCSAATGSATVKRPWFDPTTVMPPHTWRPFPETEVKMRPEVSARGFSAVNAFFFSGLSKIAYETEDEARGLLLGNSTEEGLGFDRFYWFEGGEEARKNPFDDVHDTDAFVAANDDLIAVVFRGTMGISDWYTNVMLKPRECPPEWGLPHARGAVHTGFDDGVSTVWLSTPGELPGPGMLPTIKDLYNEKGKRRKLFLAGHSLGGALATIAAARLAFIDDIDIAGIYTIGSPRLFNRPAAKHFDSWLNHDKPLKDKCFRCRNNKDPVTILPGNPYVHVGTEIYIDQFGTISMASMADRLLDQLLWWLRFEYIRGIDDHSTSEYIRLFKQIILNSRVPIAEKAVSVAMDAVGDLALRFSPDAVGNMRKMFAGLLKGTAKNSNMVDDMFQGMERRRGEVEIAKNRAMVASQEY